MVYFKKRSTVLLLAFSCTLAACSSQPSYTGNSTEQSLKQHTNWQYTQEDAIKVSYITDLVNIAGLDSLIEQAIANNPSFNQVHVALKLAYAQRDVTAASQWFSINADFDAQRNETTGTQYSSSLGVSWEADVWQKIADNVAAQDMTIASNQATYQSAKDTLVASVIRTYLNIILQQDLLNIEQQRLTVLENNEQSIVERYQYGLGDLEALDTARTNTASTRATIADYQEQIAQAKRALVLLVGVDKLENLPSSAVLPEVMEPLSALPEQDLARRPDLQSAYYNIQSKRYLVDVAYKDLLPSITLSASLSDLATTPSKALLTSPVWNLLGSLSAPLFQGGALRAQVDIAKLNAEQAFWEYQDTLLSAVNEVENALGQEQSLTQQQLQISNALASAKRSYSNYQSKYQQGLVDILDLLTVQQQVYDLQAQLSQINYTLLTNRIDLGLALGLGASS
ncbi:MULTISPECIES: TolC family protein [Pseudoalteromonas]|uniref:TolC family protein n=1 Tax=Pseudoalteromonas undina TaxID=43660 RepID=A0ACC6R3Y0_9GAMM|nr:MULTISPECIES: TolC family protein [unclassified Pseudoalteromonas]KPZ53314.1 Outer membrane protein OprM precursor [Pseudoalteromonas sp. P1-25]KPZ53606.1 Outer membrane protein OprM precursor [Pseudoalteromonas sp. P1-13-1a]KPZ59116.1 Outer membrane protein OprM precursor [Pseudoalteromonas sp. P1-7a]